MNQTLIQILHVHHLCHIQIFNNEPQRTIPIFDGTGDLDTFFTKFEILVPACDWTEKETICVLLNDCLPGKAESIILSFPSDSVLTYHDVKYKVYYGFVQ